MKVEYMREDKYQLYKLQSSLFSEERGDKVILVYKSPNYHELLKSCVARELPILTEAEYHEFWEKKTGGRKLAGYEFTKTRNRVNSEILSYLETRKHQIIHEKRQELLKSLEGRKQELEEFKRENPNLPSLFWIQMQIGGIMKDQFLKERGVE